MADHAYEVLDLPEPVLTSLDLVQQAVGPFEPRIGQPCTGPVQDVRHVVLRKLTDRRNEKKTGLGRNHPRIL